MRYSTSTVEMSRIERSTCFCMCVRVPLRTPLPIVCCGVEPTKNMHCPSSPDLITYSFACASARARVRHGGECAENGLKELGASTCKASTRRRPDCEQASRSNNNKQERSVKAACKQPHLDCDPLEPPCHLRQTTRVHLPRAHARSHTHTHTHTHTHIQRSLDQNAGARAINLCRI